MLQRPSLSSVRIVQTSSPLKPPWPIIAKFYVEPCWEGGTKVYINGPGHMTKMATTPIYGKNLKRSMIMKLGMEQYVLRLQNFHINDNPELTLTYFTTMSNLMKLVFVLIVGPDIR